MVGLGEVPRMFNILFGLGRVYKKLPQPQNAKELGDNIEVLANYFLDRGSRNALSGGPVTWEWRLGEDLKKSFLRTFVDDDTYTRHGWEAQRRSRNAKS
jgi:hypothetical protein